MANVQINWTPYDSSNPPTDVDAVEIFRSPTINNEADFQAALDGGTAGSALTSISDITGTATYTDTTAVSGTTYYYCLAAKNAGGYNVGADAPGTTVPTAGLPAGAVARVDV